MPKKKKAVKKKKGGAKKAKAAVSVDAPGPTALELTLRLELESLERELQTAKQEAEAAKKQNDWLQDEVRRTEEEANEYETYMEKKTVREQLKVQNISDQHQSVLDAIEADRTRKAKEFEENKKELGELILAKEAELRKIQAQIEEMSDFAQRRAAQEQEVSELQETIQSLEEQHERELHETKTRLLDEKLKFQRTAAVEIQRLETLAAQEAQECLEGHTDDVRTKNRELRKELVSVFALNKQLRERESALLLQNRELRRMADLNLDVMTPQTRKLASAMKG